ncbi:DNA polymerase/3'-5' exonuclease PolX [Candidatus Woesearchaeota archaeon]|nr:DNA polymerase/3'-5' exonuclease PolX [Candidatus Woesearchaeota archaeon]
MKNQELAKILYDIADILEFKNVQWKPRAYRTAARSIEGLNKDIEEIYQKDGINGLKDISGVGEGIAKKIEEFVKTGKITEYEKLKKKVPKNFIDLLEVPGVGIKKAKVLYEKLDIKNLKDLERAARQHKISKLESFKEKSEENILKGLELVKEGKGRLLLGNVLPIANEIEDYLKSLKEVKRVTICGSIRRRKETIKDIDILVSGDPKKIMDSFLKHERIKRVIGRGNTRLDVILKNGLQVNLRVVPLNCYGSALQYFTGSKEHSIELRKIALKKKLKLSEYGIFKNNKRIAGESEEGVYKALGLDYIEPELRENNGEIRAALERKLPNIVKLKDIQGIFHVHTNWSDGSNTIKEMAEACKGYKYIAICDHGGPIKIANGLDEKRVLNQIKEIDKLNKKINGIRILKGSEVEILKDGSLGLKNDVLKQLDVVIGSVHTGFKSGEKEMTNRILRAFDNSYLNILGHPTGRLIHRRDPYRVDMQAVFDKAKERNIALEINAFPDRLDLDDAHVRDAVKNKVKLAIGSDAHAKEHLNYFELGVSVARRGWAEKKDIINCLSLKELRKFLER